ncbi:beta-1,3-galactosyltransferase 5 [Anthonomus grandis grandis]|uniref:beta-1,3-galactosyltransferase 5 n=1 Tax=Anthonomus grandis grandis TaxID=2921223 RepID=UPI0021661CCF|nr:beta-1,3-galactosyltransferase 5 [Anthonomus grandis grandis]
MIKFTKTQQVYLILIIAITVLLIIYLFTETQPGDYEITPISLDEYTLNFSISSKDQLLNLTLKYSLNNEEACKNDNISALFLVTSYFGNVETRSSMRQAFSNEKLNQYGFRRLFLLAEAPMDKYTTQQSIINEHQRFGDIIQGNFTEAYRNLTYKHVMGLKWASTYCPKAKYVIKMDDDTVVNMYKLKTILSTLKRIAKRDFIAGYKLLKMKPIREPANKWYVTENEYASSFYPTFVSGWFYITNPQTAKKLSTLANYEKYFWIDDVFVTGILSNKLNTPIYDISKYFTANSEFLQCCLQDFDKDLDCDIYVGPNGGDTNMFYKFNEKVQKCLLSNKCRTRDKLLNETCVAERKVNLGRGDSIVSDIKLK